jgi:predicted ArsR family transcriptional regulator
LSVGELAAVMPVSRPAVSQHLTVLRRSGLVSYEELGTRNVYRLDPAGLSELRTWLDGFWEAALDRYAQRVREDSAHTGTRPRHEEGSAHTGTQSRREEGSADSGTQPRHE